MSRLERKVIFLFDGINTKKYTKLYDSWLKKTGIDIKGNIKYIHHTVSFDGSGYSMIHLGNNIVISKNCTLLVHDFSIEAGLLALNLSEGGEKEGYIMDDICIGDNCFVGANVTILAGTSIGDNSIVGAGSVLPGKKYPPNSIIVGNPGRVVGNTVDWAKKKIQEGKIRKGFFN